MSLTSNWKNAEHFFAKVYKRFKLDAFRDTRAGDYSKSDYEVKIIGSDWVKSDAKYSQARPFRHHGLLFELEHKYCKEKEDIGVLLTKNFKERGACITVRSEVFAMLLSYWEGKGTKEELTAIRLNKKETDVD